MLVEISFGPVSPSPLRFLAYQIGFGGDGVGVGGARAVMTRANTPALLKFYDSSAMESIRPRGVLNM